MKASQLAAEINAQLVGEDIEVSSVSSIENAKEGSLIPLLSKDIPEDVISSGGLLLAKSGFDTSQGGSYLLAGDAELALVSAVNILYPPMPKGSEVSPSAYVSESAVICEDVFVGALAFIGENTHIGCRSQIYPQAHIGDNVVIGTDCIIHPHVSIYDGCVLGNGVTIHSGTVIGADGFGYYQKQGRNVKVPHIGNVVIENDVEIGANTCIDRGKFDSTIIGEGTKIDNQVQVAHNVKIGKHCIMAGQSAIAGSTELGDYVMMGARSGVIDHVKVCSKVMLAGGCGVMSDIEKPGIYGGSPSNSRKAWMREVALVRDLPNIVNRIKALENKDD